MERLRETGVVVQSGSFTRLSRSTHLPCHS